ncbi:IS701 family transposase [Streptomyces sp. NPDC090442]|uniref:IS701 family transposase n=1 Tax=Streptomyces sp. NPDC090442 TaxID=3365962 RepID=UPI0037F1542A
MTLEQVEGWAEELAVLTGGLGHLFARPEPREVFADLIEGLLSGLGRKNGWTMAERAGHATPHRIQKFLGEASWDADALLGEVQDYIAGHLADAQATLVLDDTQVIKKGTRSVGVAHQHCGVTGDVRNCQVMVMLTYATKAGHTFYDRRLYLPAVWADDAGRRRDAGVPEDVTFATKPHLGIAMLTTALARKLTFAWVAADADYGKDPALRAFLHEQALPYVLAVPVTLPLAGPPSKPHQPAVKTAGDLLHYAVIRDRWERRSQGEGSKGQRYYDWTWFDAALPGQEPADGFAHHLLIRRSTEKKQLAGGRVDFEYAYFLVHHPHNAALPEAVCRAGVRWTIEENNEQAKQITGLGQYQVRRWNSWHRHVTCAMLALAFLTVQRTHHPGPEPAPENDTASGTGLEQVDKAGKAQPTTEASACH